MKFTCLTQNLHKGLSVVNKAIPIKSQLPILSNVLITAKDGQLTLAGTNLDTVMVVNVGASVEAEGSITVPAKLLSEFIGHLSSTHVSVELKKDILHLVSGKNKAHFNGISSQDYPDLPEFDSAEGLLDMAAKEFSSAVLKVGFSVAADSSRPVFTGIFLTSRDGNLYLVGSDAFRLSEQAFEEVTIPDGLGIVIPARTLLEVARVVSSHEGNLKIRLSKQTNLCIIESDEVVIATRIIEGTYPDYTKIVPSNHSLKAEFETEDLLEAVKLANIFAHESNAIKLTFEDETIKVASSSEETGTNTSEIPAIIEGEALEMVFSSRYLLDILNMSKNKKIILSATTPKAPCLIKHVDDDSFLHVIAPLHQS